MSNIKIINPYTTNKTNLSGLVKKVFRRDFQSANRARLLINDAFSHYFALRSYVAPQIIELETINRCNMSCSFCPVNVHVDPRDYHKMSDSLLEKIAQELAELKFSGTLYLFSNNEPLLDDRIVEICRLFRSKAPKAKISISTNGILLTKEIFLGLFDAGLDEMVVDNYNDKLKLIKPIDRLLEEINPTIDSKIEEYRSNTKIILRKKTEVLDSRGGFAPNKKKEEVKNFLNYSNHSCALPFIQFVIRPSGEISICCQDALGKVTMGDLNKNSISEVWNGPQYKEVRKKLNKQFRYGRKSLSVCDGCDYTPLSNISEVM